MRKTILTLLLSMVLAFVYSQNRKGNLFLHNGAEMHDLYVSFYDDGILLENGNKNITIEQLISDYSFTFEKNTLLSEKKIKEFASQKRNNFFIEKLHRIYKINISNPSNETLLELAEIFETMPEVEYASLVPRTPVPPPYDIMPVTENYEYLQDYLGPDPGVNMHYAWSLGISGENIRIRDIEYGCNTDHEVLNEKNIIIAKGMDIYPEISANYTEHGTAVLGIVYGHNSDFGNKGMVYGAEEVVLYPEWQSSGYNRVYAISQAIENSKAGDIIIYEMQTIAYNDDASQPYVPAEFINVIWDLTKAATDAGIIIIAAAGNGAQNLDSQYFNEYNNRGNSGAIIVGAGTNDTNHAPLPFTTYGSRVDVQAWGTNVFTCGNLGDFFQIGNDFNQAYTMFSGTSSATAIIAGCVVALQSYYYSMMGEYLTSREMRNLLVNTGIPQTQKLSKQIGSFPNIQNAIIAIDDMITGIPKIDFFVENGENCTVNLRWTDYSDIPNLKYNIYRNDELVAENITENSYSEVVNSEIQYLWCIEVISDEKKYPKECYKNNICMGGNIGNTPLKKSYEFYPNPVRNDLIIKRIDYQNHELTVVEIYNLSGSHISTSFIENEQHNINFNNFSAGIYMLKIYDSEQVIVKKIVKQ